MNWYPHLADAKVQIYLKPTQNNFKGLNINHFEINRGGTGQKCDFSRKILFTH